MHYSKQDRGYYTEEGELVASDRDLAMARQLGQKVPNPATDPIPPADNGLKTLLDFLRDNDGALFYDKARDAMYLTTHNNNAYQRMLSVGANYTAWHPLEEPCDNGEPFASESIRLSIQSLNEMETAQHGNETDVQKGH